MDSGGYREGECVDCAYYYGLDVVSCHNDFATDSDVMNGGCIFFEPKWEAPVPDEYENYQKEWN